VEHPRLEISKLGCYVLGQIGIISHSLVGFGETVVINSNDHGGPINGGPSTIAVIPAPSFTTSTTTLLIIKLDDIRTFGTE